jgi:hypothetical protein
MIDSLYIFAGVCFIAAVILAIVIVNYEGKHQKKVKKFTTAHKVGDNGENISAMLDNLYIVNDWNLQDNLICNLEDFHAEYDDTIEMVNTHGGKPGSFLNFYGNNGD